MDQIKGKEKTIVCREKEYIITDSERTLVCLSSEERREYNEKDYIRALYPGQPEIEDTLDEQVPAGSEFSGRLPDRESPARERTQSSLYSSEEEEGDSMILVPAFITACKYIYKR